MPLNARRQVRKMRGGAQSHLIEADDGGFYVVKFSNNPQHRRVLINECIGGSFLRYLQISAPQTALISVGPEFLRDNPEVSIQLGSRTVPVEPGWHFGSRYPEHPDKLAVYDYLPDALLSQVANLRQFLGMLVFDKWTANADGRQAIFFRSRVTEWTAGGASARPAFLAWMIDQGFLFNGPHWELPDSPVQGLYHRPLVYQSVASLDDFQPWLDLVLHFPAEVVDEAYRQVPLQWMDQEEDALEELLEKLLDRSRRVADLLEDCHRAKPSLFPNWK
ncbi:MAG: HipA family kinase [Bryobacteraceae bacterium]